MPNPRCIRALSDSRLTVDPQARLLTEGKKADDAKGWLKGYLAVFNNVDSVNDRIIKGAFAKTIAERVNTGKVPLMAKHFAYGGDTCEVVGLIKTAKEDEYGLFIEAEFADTDFAQEVRKLVAGGYVKGLSIGYELIRYDTVNEDNKTIFELKEIKLLEGTITAFPANELALITGSKSDSPNPLLDRLTLIERQLATLTAKVTGSPADAPALDSKGGDVAPQADQAQADNVTETADLIEIEAYIAETENFVEGLG